jgi:hypothetical protein
MTTLQNIESLADCELRMDIEESGHGLFHCFSICLQGLRETTKVSAGLQSEFKTRDTQPFCTSHSIQISITSIKECTYKSCAMVRK